MGSDISRLIETINRVGIQNLALLSNLTGMPYETVRYILRKRFPKLGLQVGTLVSYESLGLGRWFAKIKFKPSLLGQASSILHRLSNVAFLTFRSRTLLESRHLAMFAVPVTLEGEFRSFLDGLVAGGVVEQVDLELLEWARHPEIKSRYFDFPKKVWKIDWDTVKAQEDPPPSPVTNYEPSSRPELDGRDTLLIKELEMDSCRSIAEIAKKLNVNERTLRWHHSRHVGPVINSHYVRWLPVGTDRQKAVGVIFEFRDLPQHKLRKVRQLFNNFPFTWYEGGRRDGYYQAHSAIPTDHFVESLGFLNENLVRLGAEWNCFLQDLSASQSYTIPYEHFSDPEGWRFDKRAALDQILSVSAA